MTETTNVDLIGETAAYSQTAMLWFSLITILYFGFRYINIGKEGTDKANKVFTGIYLLTVLFVIGVINYYAVKAQCVTDDGSINNEVYVVAMMSTFLPWILIFISLLLILSYFPGWKAPFSNTIGYLVVSAAGVKSLIQNIVESEAERVVDTSKTNENIKLISSAINNIYTDPSLLINEITPANFNNFWENLKPIMQKGAYQNVLYKSKLYKLVVLKDMISEFIWYMLTSIIISSVSYNYILSNDCKKSGKVDFRN